VYTPPRPPCADVGCVSVCAVRFVVLGAVACVVGGMSARKGGGGARVYTPPRPPCADVGCVSVYAVRFVVLGAVACAVGGMSARKEGREVEGHGCTPLPAPPVRMWDVCLCVLCALSSLASLAPRCRRHECKEGREGSGGAWVKNTAPPLCGCGMCVVQGRKEGRWRGMGRKPRPPPVRMWDVCLCVVCALAYLLDLRVRPNPRQ
jgi:hypothetical protein